MNILDFLEKTNYYIQYNFDATNGTASITSTFDPNINQTYQYIDNKLVSENMSVECPSYMCQILIDAELYKLCEFVGYPHEHVVKKFNNNRTYYLRFPVEGYDETKLNTMMMIAEELTTVGLKPKVIELVKEAGVGQGFKLLFKMLYHADIVI